MSLIVRLCGRKFRHTPSSTTPQEVSEEVRQHLHGPSGVNLEGPAGNTILAAFRRNVACELSRAVTAIKLVAVRVLIAARPVLQLATGL